MTGLEASTTHQPSFIPQLWDTTAVAEAIQNTLAPSVAYQDQQVEAYGQTIPRDCMGGDLLDLAATDRGLTTYVADISGHGFRAGVLMGMVKTAVRYGLLLGQALPALLEGVNRVLPALKESSMYATLAALRFDSSEEAEYITAGHLPLLHCRQRQRDVESLISGAVVTLHIENRAFNMQG